MRVHTKTNDLQPNPCLGMLQFIARGSMQWRHGFLPRVFAVCSLMQGRPEDCRGLPLPLPPRPTIDIYSHLRISYLPSGQKSRVLQTREQHRGWTTARRDSPGEDAHAKLVCVIPFLSQAPGIARQAKTAR